MYELYLSLFSPAEGIFYVSQVNTTLSSVLISAAILSFQRALSRSGRDTNIIPERGQSFYENSCNEMAIHTRNTK